MIPAMSRMVTIPSQIYKILGRLLLSLSLFRLAPPIGPLLLRFVMRMSLFVVLTTLAAEKEQNLLRVARPHALILSSCRILRKSLAQRS